METGLPNQSLLDKHENLAGEELHRQLLGLEECRLTYIAAFVILNIANGFL
jgi:hypothetical protein